MKLQTLLLLLASGFLSVAQGGFSPYFENGTMDDGFITAEGDSIPVGWGSIACFGSPDSEVCIHYDDDTYTSAPAALGIQGNGDPHIFMAGINHVQEYEGYLLIVHGMLKADVQTGAFVVYGITGCTGGHGVLLDTTELHRMAHDSDWYAFEGAFTVRRYSVCEQLGNDYLVILMGIAWEGEGQAWVDDLWAEAIRQSAVREPGLNRASSADVTTRHLENAAVFTGERLAHGTVYSASGRIVRSGLVASQTGTIVWDQRNGHGRRVGPGLYYVELVRHDGSLVLDPYSVAR